MTNNESVLIAAVFLLLTALGLIIVRVAQQRRNSRWHDVLLGIGIAIFVFEIAFGLIRVVSNFR